MKGPAAKSRLLNCMSDNRSYRSRDVNASRHGEGKFGKLR